MGQTRTFLLGGRTSASAECRHWSGRAVRWFEFAQRAALHAVAPHLQASEQQNLEPQNRLAREARARLDAAVERAVPNYREIDQDPRWHNWLRSVDPLSGRVRQTLLDEAIASVTPHRVISFFQQFLQSGHTAQATFHGQSSSGRTYTRAQIKQLYEHHRRGGYAGREQAWAQQEADILRAAAEGRVLNPDNITK